MKRLLSIVLSLCLLLTLVSIVPFSASAANDKMEIRYEMYKYGDESTQITNANIGDDIIIKAYLTNYDTYVNRDQITMLETKFVSPDNSIKAMTREIAIAKTYPTRFQHRLFSASNANKVFGKNITTDWINENGAVFSGTPTGTVFTSGTHYNFTSKAEFNPDMAYPQEFLSNNMLYVEYVATVVSLPVTLNTTLTINHNNPIAPQVTNGTLSLTAPVSLTPSVSFVGKSVLGTNYKVTLTGSKPSPAEYKVFAKDTVYGWIPVSEYAVYNDATGIAITVPNPPADGLQIEVVEKNVGTEPGKNDSTTANTKTFTSKDMGMIGVTADSVTQAAAKGAAVAFTATPQFAASVGAVKYEVIFGDSKTVKKGTATDGQAISLSENAVNPGTHNVTLYLYAADDKDNKYLVKSYKYVVTDIAAGVDLPAFTAGLTIPGVKTEGTSFDIAQPLAELKGKTAAYKYRFVAPVIGGTNFSFNSNNGISIPKPGIYYVYADVYGDGVIADTAFTTVKIARNGDPVLINNFTSAPAGSYAVGTTYTFTVDASANATEFMFIRRDESGYRTVQNWSSTPTWTWTPAREGIYEIYAYAKGENAGSYEAVKSIIANVGSVSATEPTFGISSATNRAGAETTVTVNTPAAGYKYAFEIYDPFNNQYIFSGYQDSNVYTFVPAKANRTYRVTVLVKLPDNSGAYDAKSTQTFTTLP